MIKKLRFLSVKNSNYQFTHWSKEGFSSEIGLVRLFCDTNVNDDSLHDILSEFYSSIWLTLRNKYEIYLFLGSNVWLDDTQINRYHGLWRWLKKTYPKLKTIQNFSENIHIKNKKIRFSGMVKIKIVDLETVILFLLNYRVGILFGLEKKSPTMHLEKQLYVNAIMPPGHSMDHMLNVPCAINYISNNSGIVIYPNGSEDFGGIYLDIFGKFEVIRTLDGQGQDTNS